VINMKNIDELLAAFHDIATHPGKQLKHYTDAGKKVVGYFPIFIPEEIIHAGGLIPMGLYGTQITPTIAGKYNPIFTCSIMRSCLELGMTGKYDGLSAVVMPMLCDTFRGMSSAWRSGVKNIPVVSFIHPQNRKDTDAKEFLADEYRALAKDLMEKTGREITEESLKESIGIYNQHTKVMNEFVAVANEHLDIISPVVRHEIMKSAHFLEKKEHTEMMSELIKALEFLPKHQWKGKKIILSGILAEPVEFLNIFVENKIAVVGDDLAQESQQYRTSIPLDIDPYASLAQQWLNRKGSSTIHEDKSSRADIIIDMAQKTGADGIAVCLMRFCDVEEYEYPFISEAAEKVGFPVLCLEIDQSTQNNEQSRTKVQSFAEN